MTRLKMLFFVALLLYVVPMHGYSSDLSQLTVKIPVEQKRPIKLDYLATDIVAQLDDIVKEPFGVIVESTECRYFVDPSVPWSYFISPYPALTIPGGSYTLAQIKEIIEKQGIVTVFDATSTVVYFIEKPLFDSPLWPLNRKLLKGAYGVVDSTRCAEILYDQDCDERMISDSRFISGHTLFSLCTPQIDLSKTLSVRQILGAIAVNGSQAREYGLLLKVSTHPSDRLPPTAHWNSIPTWIAGIDRGFKLLELPEVEGAATEHSEDKTPILNIVVE